MHLPSAFAGLSLASGVLAVATTRCNANNCARAVTGTRSGKVPDVSSRMADCSSFQQSTVTANTSTVTTTVTITGTFVFPGPTETGTGTNTGSLSTTIGTGTGTSDYPATTETAASNTDLPVKRQATDSGSASALSSINSSIPAIPVYASACTSAAAYRSACSCWGITGTIVTATTPVTTVTVTATATVSVCAAGETLCNGTCSDLGTDPDNCGACGNSCPSGICVNSVCSTPGCAGSTCDSLNSCGNGDCFCFETSDGTGFCGPSELCSPLADCNSTADCEEGTVCATGTCCGRNVCIQSCGAALPRREVAGSDNATELFTNGWTGAKLL